MPGIKGMAYAAPRTGSLRSKIWQSMRIMRRFTAADLCRTSGARRNNVRKFIKRLEVHGYVAQQGEYAGGRPGAFRGLRLVKDIGPRYPALCQTCGRPLSEPCIKADESAAGASNGPDDPARSQKGKNSGQAGNQR
jgi:hypothetical protein